MRKEKWYHKIGNFFNRYINGTKGAISILLVIAVSPLLTIALLLVESARYQSAVELIKEVSNSSAFSTLADYDSHLESRFGVFAVDQTKDVDKTFDTYMAYNDDLIGKGITVTATTALGQYPLSYSEVLKKQIMEFGALSVTTEVLTEGFDIDELLKKLREALNLKDLTKEIETLQAGMDIATEVEKIIESLIKLPDQYSTYQTAYDNYWSAYDDLEESLLDLSEELADAEEKLKEDETHDAIYEKWAVKNALSDASKKMGTYKTRAETLKKSINNVRTSITTLSAAAKNLPGKLKTYNDKTDTSKVKVATKFDWILTAVDTITSTLNGLIDESKYQTQMKALEDQIKKLGQYTDRTVDSSWDETKIYNEYSPIILNIIDSNLKTRVNTLISTLNEKSHAGTSQTNQMGTILTLVRELLAIQLAYDPALNAQINPALLYSKDTGIAFSDKAMITSITLLLDAGETFKKGISEFNFLKAIAAVVELLAAIITFLTAVITWVTGLWNVITNMVSDPVGNFVLFGYGVYNMPNRTICKKNKALTGFSYLDLMKKAGANLDAYGKQGGTLKDLANQNYAGGQDSMFKGAVAEYLLVGTNNELYNQSCVFLKLYMLRLVLDIIPIFNSDFVNTVSAAAGPGAMLVKIGFALVEPFLDAMFLVNDVPQYIFKEDCYFSYKGLVSLQKDLNSAAADALPATTRKMIESYITNTNGKVTKSGKFLSSYTEHLVLLMFMVEDGAYMTRLQNIIQLEGKAYNGSSFKLGNAYTYVKTDVTYQLNPMFNIEGLTDGNAFTGKTTKYVGY